MGGRAGYCERLRHDRSSASVRDSTLPKAADHVRRPCASQCYRAQSGSGGIHEMDGPYCRELPSRTAGTVTWQVVTDRAGLSRLEAKWRSMEGQWQGGTPFQTFAWCSHWLEHRGKHYSPFVMVRPDGAVIAPF